MRRVSGRWLVCCGVGAALYTLRSIAADEATGTGVELEEVVVTAEKREERLIDVPMSVTAMPAAELANSDLVQLRDYYSRIPGLQYNGDTTYDLSLRGITTGGATNPTLAILVDDVQFGSSTAAGLGNGHFPDFDPSMLDHLEVLRGPQGTLYGASSLGGLLKFVTKQPDLQNLSGRVEAGFESVQGGSVGWTTRGAVNIPLVTDMVALQVSAFKRVDPAWLNNVDGDTNAILARNVNTADTYGGHGTLLIKPTDDLSITLSALEQKRSAQFYTGSQVQENAAGYPDYGAPVYGSNRNVSLGPTADIGNQQLYSARIEYELDGIHLTSLTAYGKSSGTNYQDVTSVFTFLPLFYGPGSTSIVDLAETEKFSQELRLSGTVGPLDWRGGLFYTREAGSVDQTLDFSGAETPAAVPYASLGPDVYKERAVFADFTYHVTTQLEVQAGARWARNQQSSGSSAVVDPTAVPAFGPSTSGVYLRSDDTSTTWEVSPVYHLSSDLMTYLRVATGYRPGGPNAILAGVPSSFGPDKVTNYEVGFKGNLPAESVSFDVALFDIEWKNIQLQDTDSATEFTYTTNGGKARSRGIEAESGWRPYKGLTIDANATYTDATLTEDLVGLTTAETLVGRSGNRLPASAKFTSNLNIRQDFPIANSLGGYVSGNWSFIGSRESTFTLSDGGTPRFTLPSYSLVDFETGVLYGSGWRATLFLRNAFNKLGVVTADNRNGTSVTTVNFLQPRTVGMNFSKEF